MIPNLVGPDSSNLPVNSTISITVKGLINQFSAKDAGDY
jgi:hypothetical protein